MTNKTEMFKGMSKLSEAADSFKERMLNEAKTVVVEGAKELFDKFPGLLGVRWHQYTPGFNDGEPCYHSFGNVEFSLDEDLAKQLGVKCEDDWVSDNGMKSVPGEIDTFIDALAGLEDALELAFDTNKEITINRDGSVEVSDYDCGY